MSQMFNPLDFVESVIDKSLIKKRNWGGPSKHHVRLEPRTRKTAKGKKGFGHIELIPLRINVILQSNSKWKSKHDCKMIFDGISGLPEYHGGVFLSILEWDFELYVILRWNSQQRNTLFNQFQMAVLWVIRVKCEHGNDCDKRGRCEVFPREGEEMRVGRFFVRRNRRNYGRARNPCRWGGSGLSLRVEVRCSVVCWEGRSFLFCVDMCCQLDMWWWNHGRGGEECRESRERGRGNGGVRFDGEWR